MKLAVRPAVRADTAALVRCWERLIAEGAAVGGAVPPRGRDAFRTRVEDLWFGSFLPFPAAWVADVGEVAGFVSGLPVPDHPLRALPRSARIEDLWVHPQWRRRGIATSLVTAFEGAARRSGYARLEVGTYAADAQALAFWRSAGFFPWTVFLQKE